MSLITAISARLRGLGHWLSEHEFVIVLIILAVTLGMHFATLTQPGILIGDESHYVKDARSILHGYGMQRPEHPSLAKVFIVWGIRMFGDNPWGWRLFPILFSTLSILLFFLICRRFISLKYAALMAVFLFAFENMSFVQGSVAMLDVYSVTFMLLAFWLYLRGNYAPSAIALAASAVAKLGGAFAAIAIGLHWLMTRRGQRLGLLKMLLITPAAFLALMPLTDYAVLGEWLNPISRLKYMLGTLSSLTFAHYASEVASRPWEWVIRPLVYFPYCYGPPYMSMLTVTFWALIIPSMLYMFWPAIKGSNWARFSLCWFAGTYLSYIPMNLITDRITYVFYFYPTVPAVAMAIAFGLAQLLELGQVPELGRVRWIPRIVVSSYLVAHLVILGVIGPVFY